MTLASTALEPALSSLIFTLSAAPELQAAAIAALASHPGLTLGEHQSRWIPGVLESTSPRDAFRDFERIPGVELVEVVYVEVTAPQSDPDEASPGVNAPALARASASSA
jgi:hypothetical protein